MGKEGAASLLEDAMQKVLDAGITPEQLRMFQMQRDRRSSETGSMDHNRTPPANTGLNSLGGLSGGSLSSLHGDSAQHGGHGRSLSTGGFSGGLAGGASFLHSQQQQAQEQQQQHLLQQPLPMAITLSHSPFLLAEEGLNMSGSLDLGSDSLLPPSAIPISNGGSMHHRGLSTDAAIAISNVMAEARRRSISLMPPMQSSSTAASPTFRPLAQPESLGVPTQVHPSHSPRMIPTSNPTGSVGGLIGTPPSLGFAVISSALNDVERMGGAGSNIYNAGGVAGLAGSIQQHMESSNSNPNSSSNILSEYHCSFQGCYRVFHCPETLRNHMRTHASSAVDQCPFCPRTFFHHTRLETHVAEVHAPLLAKVALASLPKTILPIVDELPHILSTVNPAGGAMAASYAMDLILSSNELGLLEVRPEGGSYNPNHVGLDTSDAELVELLNNPGPLPSGNPHQFQSTNSVTTSGANHDINNNSNHINSNSNHIHMEQRQQQHQHHHHHHHHSYMDGHLHPVDPRSFHDTYTELLSMKLTPVPNLESAPLLPVTVGAYHHHPGLDSYHHFIRTGALGHGYHPNPPQPENVPTTVPSTPMVQPNASNGSVQSSPISSISSPAIVPGSNASPTLFKDQRKSLTPPGLPAIKTAAAPIPSTSTPSFMSSLTATQTVASPITQYSGPNALYQSMGSSSVGSSFPKPSNMASSAMPAPAASSQSSLFSQCSPMTSNLSAQVPQNKPNQTSSSSSATGSESNGGGKPMVLLDAMPLPLATAVSPRLKPVGSSAGGKHPCTFEDCGKTFGTAAQLTAHKKQHQKTHEFQCQYPECGKIFPQVKSLLVHGRIHTGDRPYVCPVPNCGKSFRQASGLRSHNFTHTGERPYVCRICQKSYTTSSRLKIHFRNHTEELPYKCAFEGCTKAFKQSSNLRQHEQTHIPKADRVTAVREIPCGFCGGAYKTVDSLEQHIRKMHPGKTVAESNSLATDLGLMSLPGESSLKRSIDDEDDVEDEEEEELGMGKRIKTEDTDDFMEIGFPVGDETPQFSVTAAPSESTGGTSWVSPPNSKSASMSPSAHFNAGTGGLEVEQVTTAPQTPSLDVRDFTLDGVVRAA
ncbi:hypothetical protein HDU97_000706 [Phlyctochytrium planicorne]|nr:hypothetical protein HDU97_000706 [Phlyctochytrium planicorne]